MIYLSGAVPRPCAAIRWLWERVPVGSRRRVRLPLCWGRADIGVRWGEHRIICWEAVL